MERKAVTSAMVKRFAVIMLVVYAGALACQTVCICHAGHSSSVATMLDMGDGPHGGHITDGDTGAPHQTDGSQGTVDSGTCEMVICGSVAVAAEGGASSARASLVSASAPYVAGGPSPDIRVTVPPPRWA